ncbi:MAG: Holliday junction branch migration protein RuvA [Anaerolineae bacterium]|nr:Holliday junction branch migration protein RuvA [Anaerolineae bacterium]
MIALLKGTIISIEDDLAILDVGGVGFAIFIPSAMDLKIGKEHVLYTYLHVRENELALYGFAKPDEKFLFVQLLAVNGVGPKAALSVMSTLSSDTVRRAVINDQPEVLSRAPGVGKKTAQAIVLHLKDKLARHNITDIEVDEDDADVVAALTALGFSIVEAQRALQQLPHDIELSLDEKIRRTLAMLGR